MDEAAQRAANVIVGCRKVANSFLPDCVAWDNVLIESQSEY